LASSASDSWIIVFIGYASRVAKGHVRLHVRGPTA
jgi:hypothetical protein